nr:glutathione hydrolase 7 isoform X1 [Ciona intestinalis]|eukprot:XP_002119453.1 glutathione hydrolase 7 isoform X1 [Ciona intestinalis]
MLRQKGDLRTTRFLNDSQASPSVDFDMDGFANTYERDAEFAVVTLSPSTAHFTATENSTPSSDTQSTNVFIMPSAGETSPLKETTNDPFSRPRWMRNIDGFCMIIISMVVFSISITVALIIQIYTGKPQIIPTGGVMSSDPYCTKIGLDLLQNDGGSSADAAVLTALCLTVTHPHAASIGGGGFALVHQQKLVKGATKMFNFREVGPSYFSNSSNVNSMFNGKPISEVAPQMSIAVPGFILGLQKLHETHGKLPWSNVVSRIAVIARNGIKVSPELSDAIQKLNLTTIPQPLRDLITKSDNSTKLKQGDLFTQPQLANTLEAISTEGARALYTGALSGQFLGETAELGSVLSKYDLNSYAVNVTYGINTAKYKDMALVTGEYPSSGYALHAAVDTMLGYPTINPNSSPQDSFLQDHRLIEALKYSYAQLSTPINSTYLHQVNGTNIGAYIRSLINDTHSYPMHHYLNGVQLLTTSGGQQHVCVIGPDDIIITITMSLGSNFGSKLMASGFILNNAMLDFSWEGKVQSSLQVPMANYVRGGAQPVSSLIPAIVIPSLSKCGEYLMPAARSRSMSVSGIAQVLMRKASNLGIKDSIAFKRFNQVMSTNVVQLEDNQPTGLAQYLRQRQRSHGFYSAK